MRRRVALLGICALALATVASSAGATFEGSAGKIAFSRDGDRPGLFVARRDGSHIRRLTRGRDGSLEWSPQGDRIAFLRASRDGYSSVQVIGADGTGRVRLSPDAEQGCGVQVPHWSYDGLFIAYAHDCFDLQPRVAELRIATSDGASHVAITDQTSLNLLSRQPWSPNLEESSRLTFTSDRDGDSDVYVMNSDGSDVHQLTDEEGVALEAVWSPDDSAIAYTVQDQTRPRSSIWKVATGGEPVLVVQGTPHATEPLWSPDGSRLAVTRLTREGAPTLVVVDADGGNEIVIGAGLPSLFAAWSPNSRALLVPQRGNLVRYRLGPPVTRRVVIRRVINWQPADWQAR